MKKATLTLAVFFLLTTPAQAHLPKHYSKGMSQTLRDRRNEINLAHVSYVCAHGWGEVKKKHCQAEAWLKRIMAPPVVSTPTGLPPHYDEWVCIHQFEGSWNDSGWPYYGGLQMDLDFQASYGGSLLAAKGTADNWTPVEQMWVAEKAWKDRGFGPWPNTAAKCGLR
jgi:hypothetical protein